MRHTTLAVLLALTATTSLAQEDAAFDAANRSLHEQSFSRACDGFTAFIKANPSSPLVREADVKRIAACARVSKADLGLLYKFADTGEKDYARAWAAYELSVQGYRGFGPAIPLLKQAAEGEGRAAKEARAALVRGCLLDIERNSYNAKQVEEMTQVVLAYSDNPTDKAHARIFRARAHLQDQRTQADGEKELVDLGAGTTEYADDALYTLGERRENEAKYSAALEYYDSIVTRFSSVTSNMRSNAESRAREIRRPQISVSVGSVDLPGIKPQVSVSWRNVRNAKWSLRKVDPMAATQIPIGTDGLLKAAGDTVSTWTSTLDVPVKYAPGSNSFELDLRTAGVFMLEVSADGQTARDWVLTTQTAVVTKSDRSGIVVFVADAETGQAQAGSDVVVWVDRSNAPDEKLTGKTDATGVARFDISKSEDSMVIWAKSGASYALARAGNAYRSSWSKENLAYVLTDRPLYKPGESVGMKLFLRTREGGPSTPLANKSVQLRITDPTGKEIAKPEVTTNDFGTAQFGLALPKNAALGQWYISIYQSNVSYQQRQNTFRVEEYKPPEYTVSVEPIGAPKPGEKVKFKVKASFYSGGPVANAAGRAIVQVQNWNHTFGPWPDAKLGDNGEDEESGGGGYGYDDEYGGRSRRGYYPGYYGQLAAHTLQFKTGPDGSAEVEVPALQNAPDQLQYSITVFVTDASRREIQGTGSVKVAKAAYFVDLRTDHYLYRPGERVTVQLRAEDPNGKAADPDVVVRLMRIAEDGTTAKIAETKTKVVKGKGTVQLDADAIGMVRAEVLDGAAGSTQVLAQTDLWLTSDTKPILPPMAGFQLYMDRAPLKAGQKVRALVAANRAGGSVLLTLESDVIHSVQAVELTGRARFIELPLTAPMAPNCWLSAFRFEDSQGLQQMRPLRVAGSEVELGVGVAFNKATVEPGSQVTASITLKKAPPKALFEVALTVVDEALFAIEKERKDFLAFFGRHPAQQVVRTNWSQSERYYRPRPVPVKPQPVQPVTDRRPETEKLKEGAMAQGNLSSIASGKAASADAPAPASAAPGRAMADEEQAPAKRESRKKDSAADDLDESGAGQGPNPRVRTDFGTSAGWWAALESKTPSLNQPVKLTDSLTSWKAIATVVSNGPHLGVGSGSIRTEKPLMVRLQAPRFFIEGDEVTLSAVVESHLAAAADVEVSISAPGFKELQPGKKTIHVAPGETTRFDARYKVVELGDRTIRAMVKGGGTGDAMEWKLPAFVHGSAQRQFFAGRLADRFSFEFDMPEKRKSSLTRFELALSPSLLAVMFDGLPYLAQYPYGCVEQTLSRFVPATIARRAVKDLDLPATRVPPDLDAMVASGIERLYGFQHGDGGWGWWHDDATNKWMSAYVVYALSLAREAGVQVDANVINRGRAYLTSHLGEALNDPETHVFMVFALSQTGGAPKPAVDKVFERRTTYSAKGRALVALSLLSTKDKRARIAVENLDDVVKAAQARKDASVGDANDVWSTSAAIEGTALTLMAMARYDLKSPNIAPLTDFLVLRRNGGKWRTTRDTAFAIYALSDLARREGASTQSGQFIVYVNGKEVKRVPYSKGGLELGAPLTLDDKALKGGKNVIEVKRDGGGTGYFAATVDVFNMNDFIKGVGGDVKMKRTYTLLGKPSTEKSAVPTEYGMPVESGMRMRVDLELTANKAVEFMMIEDLKPAGFEAVQLKSGPEVCNYTCAHAELRTDRVAMFLPQIPVGTTRVSYELRAEVPGRFAALPARAEAMYAPEIQATADEMRFEVRDEPTTGVAKQ